MEASITTFDRRQIYRPFLARLNPSSLKAMAVGDLVVPPQHDPRDPDQPPIHVTFANAAELNRGIQMALVGGIGSGKSTELWLARRLLDRHADAITIQIDLAEMTDLNELNPGSILIAIGMEFYRLLSTIQKSVEIRRAHVELERLAHGKTQFVHRDSIEDSPDYSDELVAFHRPGLLEPRFPIVQREVAEVRDLVSKIAVPLLRADAQITVLIDGLDRLVRPERFRQFAEQDLRALRDLQISVVVAAPLLLWFDQGRFLQNYFDEVKHIPAAISDPGKSDFLKQVLLRRGAGDLMTEHEVAQLAQFSGGVLRDLITLARSSAEGAYRDDKDHIDQTHVRSAIRQLGKRYLVGLGKTQLARLRRLEIEGEFSADNSISNELLVNRQVLEYFSEGRDFFAVHPALAEVLRNS